MSMPPDYVPLYYQTARQLAHLYKNQIQVKVGLEVDYDPKNIHTIQKIIQPLDFDVIGGSVHFIDQMNMVSSKDTAARESEHIDIICNGYLVMMDEMIENMDMDILCHLDVFKKFGRRPSAEVNTGFDALLSKIKRRKLTVELNTSGYNHKLNEFYPSTVLLKKCVEKDIRITLGSDAHKPRQVARHFGAAINLLTKTGFRTISAFTRRKPYNISLTARRLEIPKIQNGGTS